MKSSRLFSGLLIVLSLLFFIPLTGVSAEHIPNILAVTAKTAGSQTTYSLSVKILLAMTALTVLPALFMTLTCFTRVIIVLVMLRQAIGMPTVPTNQILLGLSIFLTLFIMMPVFQQMNTTAIQPYMAGKMDEVTALQTAEVPLRGFMLRQTRKPDLALFMKLSHTAPVASYDAVPFFVLAPAFLTSELKTAFQIGFFIYLPFLVIDMVVSSVLMSMGMMMLSPLVISLPFKILLFVLSDGWTLVISTLQRSFH